MGFQEVKGRVDRCEARRIRYDRAAFVAKSLESSAPKDKLETARTRAERAKEKYEVMVEELVQELPLLHGARRQFFADTLQCFFTLQKTFHTDVSYIFRDMSEYVLVSLRND